MTVNSGALEFVDTIDIGSHAVLFYENPDFARNIEYRYILNGLQKGESCVYTTHHREPQSILQQMKEFGIDVEKYTQKNQLRVIKITDPRDHPDGIWAGLEQIRHEVFDGIKTPIRLVSRFIRQIESEDDIKTNMMFERKIQSAFDGNLTEGFFGNFNKFEGSFICPYHISPSDFHSEWMINHIKNHHDVIFSDEHMGRGAHVSDLPREESSADQKNKPRFVNKYLVKYKVIENSAYESWMSEESVKSLRNVLAIEHMKIINLR